MAAPKPKAAKRKKRRQAPRPESVEYIVAIDGWNWSYSLSLNADKHPIDPYNEYRHLRIDGRVLRPTGLKVDRIEVTLLPSVEMDHDKRKDAEPLALGSLSAHDDRITGLISIPQDALPPILQMLIAKEFRFLCMFGSQFRYRNARLRSFRLEMNMSEDDMPPAGDA